MSKGQTLQDPFLNSLRKDRIPVSIFLVNGIKLQGQIESFDQYVVLLKNTVSQMVYKHAISTVVPARNPRGSSTTTATGSSTPAQSTSAAGYQGGGMSGGFERGTGNAALALVAASKSVALHLIAVALIVEVLARVRIVALKAVALVKTKIVALSAAVLVKIVALMPQQTIPALKINLKMSLTIAK